MVADIEERIRKHTDELRIHQVRSDAKRSRNFIDRLSAAEIARTDDEAGPHRFRRVNFGHRLYDRASAWLDARGRLQAGCNPVTAYRANLRNQIAIGRDAARAAERLGAMERGQPPAINTIEIDYELREDGKVITSADHIRAQIALKEGEKVQRSTEKEVQLTGLKQYLEHIEEDFATYKDDHQRWQKILQRPAYFENVSFRFSPSLASGKEAKGADEKIGVLERWLSKSASLIKRNFAIAITPFEAYYAYGAFSLITPEDHKLALTASVIFAVALGVLGSIAGNLFLRAWRHRIAGNTIERTMHKRNAALLVLTCLVTATLVVGGADLRSKIPQAQQWGKRAQELSDKESLALSTPLEDDEAASDATSDPVAEVGKEIADHQTQRGDMLKFDPEVEDSDEVIAYGIYLAVFLAAFGAWVFSRDPYNEYSLCAAALASLRALRAEAASLRDIIENDAQEVRGRHERAVLDLRSRLWLLDRSDPIALSPYANETDRRFNASGGERREDTDTPSNDRLKHDRTTLFDHWLADRVGRYARWYIRFGGKIDEGQVASIKRHLENGAEA